MPVPELTKELIASSRVIAKGRGIRDLKRLLQDYGGKSSMWTKKAVHQLRLRGMCMSIIGMNTTGSEGSR